MNSMMLKYCKGSRFGNVLEINLSGSNTALQNLRKTMQRRPVQKYMQEYTIFPQMGGHNVCSILYFKRSGAKRVIGRFVLPCVAPLLLHDIDRIVVLAVISNLAQSCGKWNATICGPRKVASSSCLYAATTVCCLKKGTIESKALAQGLATGFPP